MMQVVSNGITRLSENEHHLEPLIVRDSAKILDLQPLLAELCVRCGQENGWEDLDYFFSLPYMRNKTPWLFLVVRTPRPGIDDLNVDDVVAALLVHEYHVRGWRTRVFATDDYAGRRTMIAPAPLRAGIARLVSRWLIEHGTAISLISYQEDAAFAGSQVNEPNQAALAPLKRVRGLRWAVFEREIHHYLPLESDFELTMANFGKRTRSHMRYYRRRAERELGCHFVPGILIDLAAFQAFNRVCSFATTDEVSAIRYNALRSSHAFLCGIRDKDGNWLSLVGGLKKDGMIEIYWQMNLDSLPDYSLSTVMRSFLIEYEISCGTKKLFIEGGTPHPMRFSFTREIVKDMIVRRNSLYAALISKIARRAGPKKSYIAQLLEKDELNWQPW